MKTPKISRHHIADLIRIFGKEKFIDFSNRDTVGLWLLNNWLASCEFQGLHGNLSRRWKLMARIAECKNADGNMFVSESGMDCDCVQYSGHVTQCAANITAFFELYNSINKYADGPFSLHPITQAEKETITPQSRDLIMEAFENGHPHSIHC